jgi:pimeloyl-ACP methyl ester carboxylesterase
VLDAERVPSAAVWGFSFGAGVALQLMLAAPARVERLALAGASLGRRLSPEAAESTIAGLAALAAAKARGELESWPAVEAATRSCPALFYAGSKNTAGMNTFEK